MWFDEVEDPKSAESKVAIDILEELSTKGYVDTTNTLMPDENEMNVLSRDVEKAIQTLKSKKLHTERTAMNIPVVRAKSLLQIILSSTARKVRIRIRARASTMSIVSLARSLIHITPNDITLEQDTPRITHTHTNTGFECISLLEIMENHRRPNDLRPREARRSEISSRSRSRCWSICRHRSVC